MAKVWAEIEATIVPVVMLEDGSTSSQPEEQNLRYLLLAKLLEVYLPRH